MLYNYYFDIAAIVLNAMLLLIVYVRQTYPTKTCTLYKIMLWLNFFAAVFDIMSAYAISFPEKLPMPVNYIICAAYILLHNLSAVAFLVYVIVLIRGNYGKLIEKILWISATAYTLFSTISTLFFDGLIYFDENLNYCHGPLMVGLYAGALIVLLYSLVLFVKHRDIMSKFQMTTNISFIVLVIGAVIIQAFFPDLLIETFCGAIAFMMMNVALDNPATYFYKNSFCFNRTAFETALGEYFKNNRPFSVLAFTFEDLLLYRKKYPVRVYDEIVHKAIVKLHNMYGQKIVYTMSDGKFAVMIGDRDADEEVKKIDSTLRMEMTVGNEVLSLTPHYCLLKHPGVVADVIETLDAISLMLDDLYKKTGQHLLLCTSDMLEAKHREAEIIHLLHDAIHNDGFDVFYQPLVDSRTGKTIGAEALLRLKNKGSLGFVGPDEFIPIAENNGMVIEIGEIVLNKVCSFWNRNKLEQSLQFIDVNLSMLQLVKRETVENLREICYENKVSPKNITFEITETAYADEKQQDAVKECVNYLVEKGYALSLDDYGSGYSTPTYLAEMPFSSIKIDKGIIWKAMSNQNFRIVLEKTVLFIHEFGRTCVCEGIENQEMVDKLNAYGCDVFQGYFYSKPLPEDAFMQYLSSRNEI